MVASMRVDRYLHQGFHRFPLACRCFSSSHFLQILSTNKTMKIDFVHQTFFSLGRARGLGTRLGMKVVACNCTGVSRQLTTFCWWVEIPDWPSLLVSCELVCTSRVLITPPQMFYFCICFIFHITQSQFPSSFPCQIEKQPGYKANHSLRFSILSSTACSTQVSNAPV